MIDVIELKLIRNWLVIDCDNEWDWWLAWNQAVECDEGSDGSGGSGPSGSRSVAEGRDEHNAATKIQAQVRGFLVRRKQQKRYN